MKPRCKHCKFWDEMTAHVGKCRRSEPFINEDDFSGIWPETDLMDWCGDYQCDESKPWIDESERE